MIIDVHTHIWDSPEQFGPEATVRIRRTVGAGGQHPDASPQVHGQAMDPVDYAVVLGFVSLRLGARISSAQVAGYVSREPTKYLGFAGIDPMGPDYLDQVDEAIRLGLVGVTISPAGQGFHPGHTRAMALYERCQKSRLPVMVHPASQFSTESMMEFAQPHLFDEVARKFPELRLIIAQVGHPWIDPTLTLISKHRHIWADLSDLVLQPWPLYNTLLAAYQQGVTDRLLVGSNFPFCTPQEAITTIYSVNRYTQGTHLPSVPREQLRSIVECDALAALGLSPPQPAASGQGGSTAEAEPAPVGHSATTQAV